MSYQFDFSSITEYIPLLLKGMWLTIELTVFAVVVGLTLGIACAAGRGSRFKATRIIVGAYVELIRNTPFIVQLFFVFFGLPAMGVKMSETTAAFLAMTRAALEVG